MRNVELMDACSGISAEYRILELPAQASTLRRMAALFRDARRHYERGRGPDGFRQFLRQQNFVGVYSPLGAETFKHLPGLGLELTVLNGHPNIRDFNLVNVITGAAQSDRTLASRVAVGIGRDRERKHDSTS